MADYAWICKLLLEIEEFANLNRLYGLRDRISLSYDALMDDIALKSQPNVQTGSRWKAEHNLRFGGHPSLERKVLQFPNSGRRSIKFKAAISQANDQQVHI